MKILIFSWRGPGHPNEGGAELVIHTHAKAWVNADHEVVVFTSFYNGGKRNETIEGVQYYRYGSQIIRVQLAAFFWYLFINKTKFDLVIDNFHGIPFFTPLFVRTRKIAFIHEVAKEVWDLNPWPWPIRILPAKFGPFAERIIFILYKNINFITVSKSTKKDLINYGIKSKNINVITNGFNRLKIKHKLGRRQKSVIYLGALAIDKGMYDAILCFSELSKIDSDWKYWVVGRGTPDYINRLQLLAKSHGIEKNVKFYGFVEEKKKYELLSKAFVLVNPSYHEGWGLVNIEANSVGTPVVAYSVHGIKDSVIHQKTGLLSAKKNYQKLANNILYLYENNKAYKILQNNSIKWSNNFSWDKAVKKSLKLINKS
jgi:glycosyltransferase involved in cell wall biosynthesis